MKSRLSTFSSTRHTLTSAVFVCVLMVTASYPQSSFAAEKFSWDAEALTILVNGSLSDCLSLKGGSRIDLSQHHRGLASLRHDVGDSQGDHGCDPRGMAGAGSVYDGSEAYFRWWMKIASNFDWGPWQKKIKFGRIVRTNEQNPFYATQYLYNNKFQWASIFNSSGSDMHINLTADFDPSDGSCHSAAKIGNIGAECTDWREYIVHVKRNSCTSCTDGFARFYINGQLADEKNGITFATYIPGDGVTGLRYAWAGFGGKVFPQLCENGGSCGAGGTIWIDDISIDTSWNSLLDDQDSRPMSPSDLTTVQ